MNDKKKWKVVWQEGKKIEELLNIVDREAFRIKNILQYLPKGRILEAGCGDGKYVFYLEKLGYEVYGVDFVEEVIAKNKIISEESGVGNSSRFKVMDICKLEFPDNYFDGYLSMGVIEHFQDPTIPLIDAYRVLKKGGIAFITVPNRLSPNHITRSLSAKFGSEDVIWQKEYTRWALQRFATSVGFKNIKSFNCNVQDSLRCGLLMESKRVDRVQNPFYYMRDLCYQTIGKREQLFSSIGYHSVFVGEK